MAVVVKTGPEDELNCSGCGYDTCRDFAIAMLEGRAEENMCVSYMRRIAHDKATVLLQKIPAGVLLVNSELKVVDMNQSCAISMGEDIYLYCGVDRFERRGAEKHLFLRGLVPCRFEPIEIIERQVGKKTAHGLYPSITYNLTGWFSGYYRIYANLMSVKNGCSKRLRK